MTRVGNCTGCSHIEINVLSERRDELSPNTLVYFQLGDGTLRLNLGQLRSQYIIWMLDSCKLWKLLNLEYSIFEFCLLEAYQIVLIFILFVRQLEYFDQYVQPDCYHFDLKFRFFARNRSM